MKSILILVALFSYNIHCISQSKNIIADGAALVLVADGYAFTEGPASDKKGNVYFTDQPNNSIFKWNAQSNTISTFMKPSGRANGLFVDNQGNLLAAADEKNELWKIDMDKNVSILLQQFENKTFNGPNDIWMDKKGGIYFTDPFYQRSYWERKEPELAEQLVYYLAPKTKKAEVIAINFVRPNGIIGSADGKTLYVADIGDNKTYAYNIKDDGSLGNRKLFTNIGSDGMTIDNQGNVYLTGDGVIVFDSKGNQIEHILTGRDWTANVTFGGPEQNVLFITASEAVYTLKMKVKGVRW